MAVIKTFVEVPDDNCFKCWGIELLSEDGEIVCKVFGVVLKERDYQGRYLRCKKCVDNTVPCYSGYLLKKGV